MKHALLHSPIGSSQALLCGSSSPQGSLSVGQSLPHQVLTLFMTSAGILLSYRCEARTGRKKLVGMQPGGNSLLLPLLKPVCPAVYLFLVYAEEELKNSPGLCLVPGAERGSFLWCPLLLEGLKPTRKKGLTFIAVLTGCCPGLASGKAKCSAKQSAFWEMQSCCTSPAVQPQGCFVIQRNYHRIGSTHNPVFHLLEGNLKLCSM